MLTFSQIIVWYIFYQREVQNIQVGLPWCSQARTDKEKDSL